jgi:uncharacterized protein YuzE
MKVKYDKEVDVLVFQIGKGKIMESDELKPGIILDFDQDGNIVRIEILDASKHSKAPFKVEYEMNV